MEQINLKREIKKFELLQNNLSDYGAEDSEPSWYFNFLMKQAIDGKPLPKIHPENWQLYETTPGWEGAANKLTEETTRLFNLIQSSTLKDVKDLEKELY